MIVTRVERIEAAAPSRATEGGRLRVFAFDLEASWDGAIDPRSGMVVNLQELKRAMRGRVVEEVAGRVLDGEDGRPFAPTPEALVRWCWKRLDGAAPGVRLARVALADRPRVVVTCHGGEDVPLDVTRIYEFSASHRLHAKGLGDEENQVVFGKCNNPEGHGHNYVLEVTLRGNLAASGEVAPAKIVDEVVKSEVVERWDHKNLNRDLPEFAGVNPTAEEIVRVAWKRLAGGFAGRLPAGAALHRLRLLETARNHVEYGGE